MTLCPVALAVGCQRCPAFSLCLLKGVFGDHHLSRHDAHLGKDGDGPTPCGGQAKRSP